MCVYLCYCPCNRNRNRIIMCTHFHVYVLSSYYRRTIVVLSAYYRRVAGEVAGRCCGGCVELLSILALGEQLEDVLRSKKN